ncbi:MAG: hypothetical protein HY815_19100 [Candidatus Riflebacteria bacterium]|nr:hypothetical protein [Candidatus Riflebacteria bacterium]
MLLFVGGMRSTVLSLVFKEDRRVAKRNCWEHKRCGREAGGARVGELGVCPASMERRVDGVNGGRCAGRACWAIAGTFCGGKIQGSFAMKMSTCTECDFYRLVLAEERPRTVLANDIIRLLESYRPIPYSPEAGSRKG